MPAYPEKNLSKQSREPTNLPHMWHKVCESNPRATLVSILLPTRKGFGTCKKRPPPSPLLVLDLARVQKLTSRPQRAWSQRAYGQGSTRWRPKHVWILHIDCARHALVKLEAQMSIHHHLNQSWTYAMHCWPTDFLNTALKLVVTKLLNKSLLTRDTEAIFCLKWRLKFRRSSNQQTQFRNMKKKRNLCTFRTNYPV